MPPPPPPSASSPALPSPFCPPSNLPPLKRCGSRLKAFLLLSDVTRDARPTEIAAGSHNTQYYSHHAKVRGSGQTSGESARALAG